MRLLIDTHVFVQLAVEPARVPQSWKDAIDDATERFLSAASVWELSIKYALGKQVLPEAPRRYIEERRQKFRMLSLSVTADHALRVADLPLHHRDPFDRILIAQAQTEELTLVSADRHFKLYEVPILGDG